MEMKASDFKARCLKLLDQVEATGEEILVLKHGRPVARVVPARPDQPWLALRAAGRWWAIPPNR